MLRRAVLNKSCLDFQFRDTGNPFIRRSERATVWDTKNRQTFSLLFYRDRFKNDGVNGGFQSVLDFSLFICVFVLASFIDFDARSFSI